MDTHRERERERKRERVNEFCLCPAYRTWVTSERNGGKDTRDGEYREQYAWRLSTLSFTTTHRLSDTYF